MRDYYHACKMTLLVATLLLTAAPVWLDAQSNWQHLAEPFGGNVLTIVEDGETIIVAAETHGVHYSSDDGQSWQEYGEDLVGVLPIGVTTGGAVVAIANEEAAVARLTNNGDSVVLSNTGITGVVLWGAVAPEGLVFVLTDDGLFRSQDGAESWQKMPFDFGEISELAALAVDGNRLVIAVAQRAFYSEDRGETILEVTDRVSQGSLSAAFTENGDIMLGTTNGLYRSSDSGATFDHFAINAEIPLFLGEIAEAPTGEFYVPTFHGNFYRVSADGRTTTRLAIPPSLTLAARFLSTGTLLLADVGKGVWRSTDTETYVQTGLPNAGVTDRLQIGPEGELIVPLLHGVARSTDDGMSWEYLYADMPLPGETEELLRVRALSDGRVVAIGESGTLVIWDEKGEASVRSGIFSGTIFDLIELESGTLLAVGLGGTWRSPNGGGAWTKGEMIGLTIAQMDDGTIFIGGAGLAVSTDDGETFTPVAAPREFVSQLFNTPDDRLYMVAVEDDVPYHYLSDENGENWTSVPLPCAGAFYYAVSTAGGAHGIALLTDCGVHPWMPESDSWRERHTPLPSDEIGFSTVLFTDRWFFAGGTDGLWRRNVSTVSVEMESFFRALNLR